MYKSIQSVTKTNQQQQIHLIIENFDKNLNLYVIIYIYIQDYMYIK